MIDPTIVEFEFSRTECDFDLDRIRKVAERLGMTLDRFISRAIIAAAEKQAEEFLLHDALSAEERSDGLGIDAKLKAWADSGAPGVSHGPNAEN
jgi:hypothetical protein